MIGEKGKANDQANALTEPIDTGLHWFVGNDGKLRLEISDASARINTEAFARAKEAFQKLQRGDFNVLTSDLDLTVKDVFQHDALFQLYPELPDARVTVTDPGDDTLGLYSSRGRITPAYAGKRHRKASTRKRCWDHPRLRGEKSSHPAAVRPHAGSPPLTRGKGPLCLIKTMQGGITPAYAGKRRFRLVPWRIARDHPRLCGEKGARSCDCASSEGSPPLMRGKVQPLPRRPFPSGITPAYAGKSGCLISDRQLMRDHPRLCGEKGNIQAAAGCNKGSPPLMRGKGYAGAIPRDACWITPAYAGKSFSRGQLRENRKDHPRLRGEKKGHRKNPARVVGSPPLTRGKVFAAKWHPFHERITPAYAGKRPTKSTIAIT